MKTKGSTHWMDKDAWGTLELSDVHAKIKEVLRDEQIYDTYAGFTESHLRNKGQHDLADKFIKIITNLQIV